MPEERRSTLRSAGVSRGAAPVRAADAADAFFARKVARIFLFVFGGEVGVVPAICCGYSYVYIRFPDIRIEEEIDGYDDTFLFYL